MIRFTPYSPEKGLKDFRSIKVFPRGTPARALRQGI